MKYLDVNLLRLRQPPKTNLNERGEKRAGDKALMFEGKSGKKEGRERNKNARVGAFLLHLGCYRSSALFQTLRPIKPDALVDDVEFDDLIFLRISAHADSLNTPLHFFDLLFEHLSKQDDALIADSEALLRAVSHNTLGFPGHRVLRRNHAHVVLPWPIF